MNAIEYKIFEATDLNSLETQMNEYARQGWGLAGNLTVETVDGSTYYTIIMVRTAAAGESARLDSPAPRLERVSGDAGGSGTGS